MTDTKAMVIGILVTCLNGKRFELQNEKVLQAQIADVFPVSLGVKREHHLDDKSIVDFFVEGIAIEVKIKGSRQDIYRQCERYCSFPEVTHLVLVTNRAMGMPEFINHKPVYLFNLGKAWL